MRKSIAIVFVLLGLCLAWYWALTADSTPTPAESDIPKELTDEEKSRQIKLLDDALAEHERGILVGSKAEKYQELLSLANSSRARASGGAIYTFRPAAPNNGEFQMLPDRLRNQEAGKSFEILVAGDPLCIKAVNFSFSTW